MNEVENETGADCSETNAGAVCACKLGSDLVSGLAGLPAQLAKKRPTLSEIHVALQRANGNIQRAADILGVTRGLVAYRLQKATERACAIVEQKKRLPVVKRNEEPAEVLRIPRERVAGKRVLFEVKITRDELQVRTLVE